MKPFVCFCSNSSPIYPPIELCNNPPASMAIKTFLFLLIFCFMGSAIGAHSVHTHVQNLNSLNQNASSLLAGIEMPNHSSFNGVSSSSDCEFTSPEKSETEQPHGGVHGGDGGDFDRKKTKSSVKLHLKHRSAGQKDAKDSLLKSAVNDFTRIQTHHQRILEKKTRKTLKKPKKLTGKTKVKEPEPPATAETFAGKLMGTLKSGVTLGSGEYFMDVFIGTPPKHFSLILDTGSDLNWLQCTPCYDCFEQIGPHYNPNHSSSYRNITCNDRRCNLVTPPDPPKPCESEPQSCPYFYWYGDSSNTTGDFATETFTVNLTTTTVDGHHQHRREVKVEDVMFGCGHWNRGLFHGAAGLLGLGRGPLSFASQLQSLYGHSFSYCLVDRNSNSSVSSKLIFGEDEGLSQSPELNFTALIGGEAPVDVFYYVHIKSVIVAGETLNIPENTWDLTSDGFGGTIIDSGTTLSYFADPAYNIIKKAFMEKVKGFPLVDDFPILEPCYNVSGVADYEKDLPSFGVVFNDGAVWNFPVGNYFIKLEPEEIVCLAVLGTPRSALSIIGNYQQQNFHIMYDTKKSRLGFAPTRCADV